MDYTLIALVLAFWLIAAIGAAFATGLKAIALALVARWFGLISKKP